MCGRSVQKVSLLPRIVGGKREQSLMIKMPMLHRTLV